jgi:hypothetical protein
MAVARSRDVRKGSPRRVIFVVLGIGAGKEGQQPAGKSRPPEKAAATGTNPNSERRSVATGKKRATPPIAQGRWESESAFPN